MKGDSKYFIKIVDEYEMYIHKTAKAILNNEEDIGYSKKV